VRRGVGPARRVGSARRRASMGRGVRTWVQPSPAGGMRIDLLRLAVEIKGHVGADRGWCASDSVQQACGALSLLSSIIRSFDKRRGHCVAGALYSARMSSRQVLPVPNRRHSETTSAQVIHSRLDCSVEENRGPRRRNRMPATHCRKGELTPIEWTAALLGPSAMILDFVKGSIVSLQTATK